MGRKKMDLTQRRISIGISLPAEIVTALSIYSDIAGINRSKVIERAILLYLAQQHNVAAKKNQLNTAYGMFAENVIKEVDINAGI